jgi:hypothetical protein
MLLIAPTAWRSPSTAWRSPSTVGDHLGVNSRQEGQ